MDEGEEVLIGHLTLVGPRILHLRVQDQEAVLRADMSGTATNSFSAYILTLVN